MNSDDDRPNGSPRILLIEDNRGDARYIQELLAEAGEITRRMVYRGDSHGGTGPHVDSPGNDPESADVSLVHESRLAAGIERLDAEPWDVLLLDLNLPDSTGIDTLSRVTEFDDTLPVVVLTGMSDRGTGLEALRKGAEEFLVKDEINADLLARSISHAVERKASELRLERQRERLAALNHLNRVVNGVTDAVIDRSTRGEIERITCERLAEAASYEFAWIGEPDAASESVAVRASYAAGDYLDEVEISTNPEEPEAQGPTGRALRTGEVYAVSDVRSDPTYEPWADVAERYGFRSSIAIPIAYEKTVYGVLNVYADRPNAFREEERSVLRQLGEIVGHAIAAADRKQALMSDSVVELELRIRDALGTLGAGDVPSESVAVDRVIPLSGGEFVMYATTRSGELEPVETLVEAVPHWETARLIDGQNEMDRFEIQLSEPPIASQIASLGGSIAQLDVEGGDVTVIAHLPQDVAVRRVIESVRDQFPETDPVARRQISNRERSASGYGSVSLATLTDRQLAVLETAYFSGYFDWPREISGEGVAEMLDISPATFSQHLRTAERKCFEELLGGNSSHTRDSKR